MFVVLREMTESHPTLGLIVHKPGDVLKRWNTWGYVVQRSLLRSEYAHEVKDDELPVIADPDPRTDDAFDEFACPLCDGRKFISQRALRLHTVKAHKVRA